MLIFTILFFSCFLEVSGKGFDVLEKLEKLETREDDCYAPPDVMGGKCVSSDEVSGIETSTITYSVDPVSDATELECEGLCAGPVDENNQDCTFGWYSIMPDVPMMWGASYAVPAIRCKGVPLGTVFTWSTSSGTTDVTSCPSPTGIKTEILIQDKLRGNDQGTSPTFTTSTVTSTTIKTIVIIMISSIFLLMAIGYLIVNVLRNRQTSGYVAIA